MTMPGPGHWSATQAALRQGQGHQAELTGQGQAQRQGADQGQVVDPERPAQ